MVIKSVHTCKLKKKDIIQICKLKNSYWNFGLKSNLRWFKKNVKKNDINNLIYLKKKIIGYTLFRKRTVIINKKKIKYLYFDTLIIDSLEKKN